MKISVRLRAVLLAAALAPTLAAAAYPDKPIKLIVPFPPGGTADIMARAVTDKMAQNLGVTVIVENKAGGAGGTVGTIDIARAAPDGYTIGIATVGTLGTSKAVTPKLPYDPNTDFSYITNIGATPMLIEVGPAVKAADFKAFLAEIKQHPDKITFGTGGTGGVAHLMAALFQSATSTKMVHVPYRGASPALNDAAGGQVDAVFDALTSSSALLGSGRLRALAISGDKRLPAFPDVPTFAELGIPQVSTEAWYGLIAPKGLPPAVTDKLYTAAKQALASPEVLARLQMLSAEPVGNTPDAFRKQVADELAKWREIATSQHIELD